MTGVDTTEEGLTGLDIANGMSVAGGITVWIGSVVEHLQIGQGAEKRKTMTKNVGRILLDSS